MSFMQLKLKRGWIVGVAGGAIALGLIGLGVAQFRQNQIQSTQKQSQTPTPFLDPKEQQLWLSDD